MLLYILNKISNKSPSVFIKTPTDEKQISFLFYILLPDSGKYQESINQYYPEKNSSFV